MVSRKRARSYKPISQGGGGGGPSGTPGSLEIGPEFGGDAPYHPVVGQQITLDQLILLSNLQTLSQIDLVSFDFDYGEQFTVENTIDLLDVAFTGTLVATVGVALTSVDFSGTLETLCQIDFASALLFGDTTVGTVVDLSSVDFSGDLITGTNIDGNFHATYPTSLDVNNQLSFKNFAPTYPMGVNKQIDFNTMDIDYIGFGGACSISDLNVQVVEQIATQDCEVPTATTVGSCNDTSNYDQQDIVISAALGQNDSVAYLEWDLSGLPSGATVVDATLTVNVLDTANNRGFHLFSTPGTGWDETTIACNNRPSFDTSSQTEDFNSTGEMSFSLNSTILTRIENRLGQDFNLVISDDSGLGTTAEIESKDEGTNDALGPRLSITLDVSN